METIIRSHRTFGPISDFTDVLRSEYCKLYSIRSTYWMLLAAVVSNIGLAALVAIILPGHLKETFDATRISLGGLHVSQIAIGVLGVLIITSEYDTGMIRTTISAVPQRQTVLAAKAIVFAVTALIVGIVASFAAFFVFQAFLTDDSLRSSPGNPGVLRAVTGGGLYLTVFGLFGFGLGAIIRRSAGAIALLLGVLFVPPLLLEFLPQSWQNTVGPYVPLEAGSQIYFLRHDAGSLGPWTGFSVFCFYAAVALGVGLVVIERRDA